MSLKDLFAGNPSTGPYSDTLEDLVSRLLEAAIGSVDPTGGLIYSLIGSPLLDFIGDKVDAKAGSKVWTTVLSTNKSASSLYESQIAYTLSSAGKKAGRALSSDIERNYGEGLASLLTSKEDWFARSQANRDSGDAGYKRFIALEGRNWASTLSLLGYFGDPFGAKAAGAALQQTAISLAQQNRRYGYTTRSAIKAASDVAENIFTGDWDEDLQRFTADAEYVPSQWNGLTQVNAAKLAAELARGGRLQQTPFKWTDREAGRFPGTPANELDRAPESLRSSRQEELRRAVEGTRRTIKEYAAALEPLKDVFGDDMDKLLQTLQSVSGTRISRMSVERVSQLSSQLSYALSSGVVSESELTEGIAASNRALSQMTGLGVYNYLAGPEQGTRALFAWKGQAFNPDYLTDSQARAHAQQLVSSTFNSQAADLFAKSYAIWANQEEQQKEGVDSSFAAFELAIQQNRGQNEDLRRAAMRLAGVSSAVDLDYGTVFDEYRQAVLSGDAGALSMRGEVDRLVARGEHRMLSLQSGQGPHKLGSADQVRANYRNIFKMLDAAPEIAAMSTDILKDFLAANGETLGLSWTRADGSVTSTFGYKDETGRLIASQETEEVAKYMNYMKADKNGLNQVLTAYGAQINMFKEVEARTRFEARKKALEGLTDKLQDQTSSWYSLVRDRDFSVEKLKDRLSLSASVLREGTVEHEAALLAVAAAKAAQDYVYRGKNPDTLTEKERETMNPAAVEDKTKRLLDYLVSPKALQNTKLTEVIEDLVGLDATRQLVNKDEDSPEKAKKLEELEARGRLLNMRLYAYSLVDPEVMDKFTSMAVYDSAGARLSGVQAEKKRDELLAEMIYDEGGGSLSDKVKWSMLDSQIQGFNSTDRAVAENIVSQYKKTADKGSDKILQVGEGWKKFFTEENKRIAEIKDDEVRADRQRILDTVNSMMNAAGSGGGLNAIGQQVVDLLQQLVDLMSQRRADTSTNPTVDSSIAKTSGR